MAIKQANSLNITFIERQDEFIYNELILSYIREHIQEKSISNFLKVNPSDSEPSTILKFISGGLYGKINKMLVLQCSDLKVLECKVGDSKTYKGKIPILFDEILKLLSAYRNVKVVISIDSINKNSKVFKKITEIGTVVLFQKYTTRQYISFVNNRCKQYGLTMDKDVVKYLLSYVDNNCAILDSELSKLSLLTDKTITKVVIRKNIVKSSKAIIFELISAIGSKRYNTSINLLYSLIEQGTAPLQIVALLQRNFRILLYVQCNCDLTDLHLNKWALQSYKEQAKHFPVADIIEILDNLVNCERLLKSSSINEVFLLNMFILDSF